MSLAHITANTSQPLDHVNYIHLQIYQHTNEWPRLLPTLQSAPYHIKLAGPHELYVLLLVHVI
jgi:hypothetical protein